MRTPSVSPSTPFVIRHLWAFPLVAILAAACSGGGPKSPTTPTTDQSIEPMVDAVIPSVDPSITHEFAGMSAGQGMTGIYNLDVQLGDDPVASVSPMRSNVAIGDTFDVDVSSILRSAPCGDCLQVDSIKLKDADTVAVTFKLAHPFSSMAARKDLHVFDVRGHLITGRGAVAFPGVTADLGAGAVPVNTTPDLVENADGYSTLFDGVAEGFLGLNIAGNTRPYKLFWKDLGSGTVNAANPTGWSNVESPRGHNVFPMTGADTDNRATATYDLHLNPGDQSLNFLFMVDASYGQSAILSTRLTPRYFLPLFNQAAPVVVATRKVSGDLFAAQTDSEMVLEVKIGDWQAGLEPPSLGFNPATSGLDEIAYNSDLAELMVHIKGVTTAPKVIDPATALSGAGTPSDPYRFEVTLANELGAAEGTYFGIIRATDDATLEATGPTALNRDTVTVEGDYHDFNTYQIFPVTVTIIPNLAPIAEIVPSRTTVPTGGEVEFCPGPTTADPDGAITKWEYDYDWDGVPANFTADAIRTPADSDKCASTIFTNAGTDPVIVTAALRVTDNGNPVLDAIDSVEITIAPFTNEPPTADLAATDINPDSDESINFSPGPGTVDPDGAITLWEYDFEWDGNPANFVADVTMSNTNPVPHAYTNPGTSDLVLTAGLRVTDNGTPQLDATDGLVITVKPVPANLPPTAELLANKTSVFGGVPVTFSPGPGTGDPDGSITLWEYDFEWDGVPGNFVADVTMADPSSVQHTYSNTGPVDLQVRPAMRVTDDGTPILTAIDDVAVTIKGLDPTPVWDFENPSEGLPDLGFSLLGTNGLERGPVPPCAASKTYSSDPPSSYNAPPVNSTWGIVSNIGDVDYPGNTTFRALEESGSTATDGLDNRYWSDAIYAIRTPVIPLNNPGGNIYLDLHHWFQTDLEYEVAGVAAGTGGQPFTWAPMPNPGLVTLYDGATVWVRRAPGGVPEATATRLDVLGPQASEPFWATFKNAKGYRWEMTSLFFMEPFEESTNWIATNYEAGNDKGFSGVSYNETTEDRNPVIFDAAAVGAYRVNPALPQWIDSRFDLSSFKGEEIVIEFRFASKKKDNNGCSTVPSGTTIYPPCIECMQNLEALTATSVNHRRSKGWRLDRIAVVEE